MSDQLKRIFDEIQADWTPAQKKEAELGARLARLQAQLIDLALQIKQARLALGLTQQELSDMSGITQAQISRIEKAKVVADVSTIFRISQALGQSFVIGSHELAS